MTINALANIYTAKVLLGQMLDRGKRCAIVTTSSGLRLIPCPGAVTYSSSKAFASWFTAALDYELKYSGNEVDMLSWDCGRTRTNMTKNDGPISPGEAVTKMLRDLGQATQTHGHIAHEMTMLSRKFYPEWYSTRIFYKLLTTRLNKDEKDEEKPENINKD